MGVAVASVDKNDLPGESRPREQVEKVLLGAAGFGEYHRLTGRAEAGGFPQSGFERREERVTLGVFENTLGESHVAAQLRQFFAQQVGAVRKLQGGLPFARIGRPFVRDFGQFLEVAQRFGRVRPLGVGPFQPVHQALQRARDGESRRCQQLAKHQRQQRALARRKRKEGFALKVLRYQPVQLPFIVIRQKFLCERDTLRGT